MNKVLGCYYLDDPLSSEEREFAEESLLGEGARFYTGATSLVEKRIPNILPVPGKDGLFSSDPTTHVQLIKGNLRKAGIRGDSGKQVLLVLPKELAWAAIFQMAIYEETGYYPYTLQRWYYREESVEKGDPRIVDVHGLTEGKD